MKKSEKEVLFPLYIFRKYWIYYLFIIFLTLTCVLNFSIHEEQHYYHLARAFLNGQLHFLGIPDSVVDVVVFENKLYWHTGPAPALFLMPFVWFFRFFGVAFYQGYLQLPLTAGILILCYKLARMWRYGTRDSALLAFAFVYSSVFFPIALVPWVWYLVQVVSAFFGLLALYLHKTNRSYWWIGICMAVLFASRFTAALMVGYFLVNIYRKKNRSIYFRSIDSLKIITPMLLSGLLLMVYNQLRFHSPWDNGYMRADTLRPAEFRYELVHFGLFKLSNIPTNIYYYFLKGVDPVVLYVKNLSKNSYILVPPYIYVRYPGTSFFVSSPVFIFLLFHIKNILKFDNARILLMNSLIILGVLLSYYWTGSKQIGPRYMIDILPMLYIALLYAFPKRVLGKTAQFLIVFGAFLNLYFFILMFALNT